MRKHLCNQAGLSSVCSVPPSHCHILPAAALGPCDGSVSSYWCMLPLDIFTVSNAEKNPYFVRPFCQQDGGFKSWTEERFGDKLFYDICRKVVEVDGVGVSEYLIPLSLW